MEKKNTRKRNKNKTKKNKQQEPEAAAKPDPIQEALDELMAAEDRDN